MLLFTLVLSLFTGVIFGLAPALKATRTNLQEVMKQSGRGSSGFRHRLQGTFVAAEIALALVLLVGAGLMVRTLGRTVASQSRIQPQSRHHLLFGDAVDIGYDSG